MNDPTQGKSGGVDRCSQCAYYEEAGIEAQLERDALRAENARLRAEVERVRQNRDDWERIADAHMNAEQERDAARARVRALEEGLRPFSKEPRSIHTYELQQAIERARALLKDADGEGGGE